MTGSLRRIEGGVVAEPDFFPVYLFPQVKALGAQLSRFTLVFNC